jgi:molybdate transport system substrate-binding protein
VADRRVQWLVRLPVFGVLLSCLLLLASCSQQAAQTPVELNVFAAASLADAFEELATTFEQQNPGVTITYNFAGSQQLAAQIGQGAPADVFASANMAQMDVAVESGRIVSESVQPFASNLLVVVMTSEAKARINDLSGLAQPGVKIILAAESVPVGKYSLEFLDKATADPTFNGQYKAQVLANVVSYEDNVRSVLTKVALGEGDAGIVYTSDLAANSAENVERIDIPANLNVIATYPIALLNDSQHREVAERYIAFIRSAAADPVLSKYGFSTP